MFAATGECFYHANLKTPKWLRCFIQNPELHSIHHEYDAHKYNFSDSPIWDRLFGAYKDTRTFTERCDFPEGAEHKLPEMLIFKDVYQSQTENAKQWRSVRCIAAGAVQTARDPWRPTSEFIGGCKND